MMMMIVIVLMMHDDNNGDEDGDGDDDDGSQGDNHEYNVKVFNIQGGFSNWSARFSVPK